jgi:LPS export ABC transporter permease LptG
MGLLTRHVFKEWLSAFALTLLVVLGLLVLQNMYDSLPDLLEFGAGIKTIGVYYILRIPGFIPAVLPIAFLVSLLLALGNLHRNNEIVAMRASGRNLLHISMPLWLAGVALSLLMLYLSADLVPRTVEQSRTMYDNLSFAAREQQMEARDIGLVHNLGFDHPASGRMWFMSRFSERAWLALGINVHTRTKSGRETHRVSAREGYFDEILGHWIFIDGREWFFDAETGDPLRVKRFEKEYFPDFKEDPNLMLALYKRPKDLSLFELRRVIGAVAVEQTPHIRAYQIRYQTLLAAPFTCLIVVALAVPFAVSGVRTNPMIGVAKCISWFFIFYALMSLTQILGNRGLLEATLTAWLPNLIILTIASVLFYRAR